ncbi:MAG: ABC transporter permease [Edaphobacter sp.]
MFERLRSLFRGLTRRHDFEEGMTEELRFHIDQYTEELVQAGVPQREAARRARIEFGSLNSIQGECREARGLQLFDELRRELGYAARLLRKTPGFTLTALLTLAICLGANLTIFAVIDSVLLRPLPFPEAQRLVTIFNTYPKAGVDRDGSSITNYYERRGHIPAFSSLSIYRFGTAILGESGSTEREQITRVSPEFFSTLGVGPVMGRAFKEEETSYKNDNVVILTDSFWRNRYHADPHMIGKQIRVDDVATTVVGILPPEFRFLSSESRLYFPLASSPEARLPAQRHSGGNVTQMIARLRPGATLAQAQAQIDAQNATLELDDPQARMLADAGFRSLVVSLHADHVASIRPTLLLLQAGVFALLLIGIVNLGNLLLIRAGSRAKELAVRQALGASRRHIVSEVLVETTLLTLMGGLLGLGAAAGGIRLLGAFGADRLPLGSQIAFDGRLAFVAVAAAVAIGVLLAVPIAWLNLRRPLGDALQLEGRSGTSGHAMQRLRHSFVVLQVALAFMLLAGSGLLGLSLQRARDVSPGFQADHILSGKISLPGKNYPNWTDRVAFTEKLVEKVGHLPGVLSAGIVTNVPLSGRDGKSATTIKGRAARPGESPRGHFAYWVNGDYFKAMGFSLLAGRFLTSADSQQSRRVCIVDEDFARYYWPGVSAIGRQLFQGSDQGKDADAFTVVGVVGSVKQAGLTDEVAQGAIYYPYAFNTDDFFVVARTSLPPESLGLTLQSAVRQIDSDLPVNDVRTMETRISDSLVTQRAPAFLAALFSAIALLLTAIGTYGVLSYAVEQRRREIGVRMALGAQPGQIRNQFLSLAFHLLAYGVALGAIGAWLAGRAMQTILFHVPAFDLTVLAAAAGVMGLVSVVACLLPSHRAARISPMEALREQ